MASDDIKAVARRFNREVIEQGSRAAFDTLVDRAFVNRSSPPGAPDGMESLWSTFQDALRPRCRGCS